MPQTAPGSISTAGALHAPLPLLCAVSALGDMAGVMLFAITPTLMAHFNVGAPDAQLTMTTFALAVALCQPIVGLLADRFGRKPMLILALAAFVLASALCVMATSIPMLAAARALQGIGAGAGMLLARAMVFGAAESQEKAARRMGVIITTIGVIGLVAPFAGGVMIERVGWQAPFGLLLAVGVLTLLWAVIQVRETRPAVRMKTQQVLPVISGLLRSRVFMGGTLAVTAVTAMFFIVISVLPVMFRALSPGQVGMIVSSLSIAFTLGAGASGAALRRWPLRRAVIGLVCLDAVIAAAALACGLMIGQSLAVFVAAASVFTLVCGLVTPMALAAVVEDVETAGAASGLCGAANVLLTGLAAQGAVALVGNGFVAVMGLALTVALVGILGALGLRARTVAA